ncbi:ChaN family lipoprotein [Pseudomonas sp. NPDC088444]|uniref:ChaN family lipoprotein n=1 Tax=Pseudomonas sp. NPDC088444 TaxID=3364456 RepID=UPI00384AA2A9
MRRYLLFLLVLSLVSACQSLPSLPPLPTWQSPEGREHVDLGMIRDLNTGQTLTPQQLVTRLAVVPRVLVGEQHDNPDHHALELWLLQALGNQRPQGSLLLEMLTPDQQSSVDAVQRGIQQGQYPSDLEHALSWQKGWNWALYGPVMRFALTQSYPVLGANLGAEEVGAIYHQRPVLSGTFSTRDSVREALLSQVRASHCGMLPEDALPAMLAIQQQRDRRMAHRVVEAPTPALLFAGSYHVRKDLGVPLHMADLGSPEAPVVLLLVQVGTDVEPGSADFVWYTAALPDQDYCAQMRAPSQ